MENGILKRGGLDSLQEMEIPCRFPHTKSLTLAVWDFS